jgi:hypothetical protein
LNDGRVNPGLLNVILNSKGNCHLLTIENDFDRDGLPDNIEMRLNTDSGKPDTNGDGIYDGVELSRYLATTIDSLPTEPTLTAVYKIEKLVWGLETCEICGEIVNMGLTQIVNPITNQTIDIPMIGLHYMKCGGFSYKGDIHNGQVDIHLLRAILFEVDEAHQLVIENDSDHDGIMDDEEWYFHPLGDDSGGDNDEISEGTRIAKAMWTRIDKLPLENNSSQIYKVEHLFKGLEYCEICGLAVNMGYVEIINPVKQDSLDVYCIGLHYLQHGGLAFKGTLHSGQIEPIHLAELLQISVSVQSNDQRSQPKSLALLQNYPNPFSGTEIGNTTSIRFTLPQAEKVTVQLFNLLGQKVRTLINDHQPAGEFIINWDGRNDRGEVLPSGLYICKLFYKNESKVIKVMVQK